MKHYPSLVFRATSSLALSVMFFAIALGLWAYQSDKLGISADVTVVQSRVNINFDEQVVPADKFGLAFEKQYESYGVKFSSGVEIGSTSNYTIPALVTNAAKIDSFVNSGAVPATSNRVKLLQQYQGSVFTTYPNALVGGSGTSVSELNLRPTAPIIMTFVDPSDPTKAATTDYVKFNLGVAEAPMVFNLPVASLPVGVNFLDKDNQVLGVRTITAAGSNTIEFSGGQVATVKIFSGETGFLSEQSWFGVDNLSFNMPGSTSTTPTPMVTTTATATLTTDKATYLPGETITGTFKNTGTVSINCPSPLTYTISQRIGTTNGFTTLFTSPGARDYQTLTANISKTVTWDQRNINGQVPDGTYRLTVECVGVSKSADFTIQDANPTNPEGTLTLDKTAYNPGQNVNMTLRNTGTVDIICSKGDAYMIQDLNGTVIFEPAPIVGGGVDTIVPAAQLTWTWDQKNSSGVQVADGNYLAVVVCGSLRKSASFTIGSSIKNLDFTVSPTSGVAPLEVTGRFTGSETSLTWDFGDGTSYVNAPATQKHTYLNAGVYIVTLRSGTALGTRQVTVTSGAGNNTPPGPTVDKVSETTKKPASVSTLVATGGSLAFNLIIASILSGIVTYMFVLRRHEPHQDK